MTQPQDLLYDQAVSVQRARLVADHWRRAALTLDAAQWRLAAHALCCVLAALDGEDDPALLGVDPGEDFDALLALRDPRPAGEQQ